MNKFARLFTVVIFTCLLSSTTASAGVIYDNGPINGTLGAWTIDEGIAASDSFLLTSSATLTGVDFGDWIDPGATPVSVQWGIGTSPDYTNSAGGGGSPVAALTNVFLGTNGAGYDMYTSSFSLPDITLPAGTYWLSLQNATTSNGDYLYWDINNGTSVAYVSTIGNVANVLFPGSNSDAFQILSSVPEPASIALAVPALLLVAGFARRKRFV